MGDFDWFQNYDLRRALELRRDGKYKQGLEVLQMASKNGCPEASYFLGEAYDGGGWSLKPNLEEAMNYYMMAHQNGCSWGLSRIHKLTNSYRFEPEFLEKMKFDHDNHKDPITRAYFDTKNYSSISERSDDWRVKRAKLTELSDQGNFVATQYINYVSVVTEDKFHTVLKLAELGDAGSQYTVGRDFQYRKEYESGFRWLLKAKQQGYLHAIPALAQCYQHGLGCPKDMVMYANYLTKNRGMISAELGDFLRDLSNDKPYDYLRALWYVGLRFGNCHPELVKEYNLQLSIRIYNATAKKVRDAMYCWMLIGKKLGLCSDVTKLIAKLVRKARKDPYLWGIK